MDDWQKKFYMNRQNGAFGNEIPASKYIASPTGHQGNNNQWQPQPSSARPSSPTASLRQGAMLYRAVDGNGFGSTELIVVPVGTVTEDIARKEFEISQQPNRCLLIESQQSVVDLGNESNKNYVTLVRVKSVFDGTFFVNESAIKKEATVMSPLSYSKNKPNLLKG